MKVKAFWGGGFSAVTYLAFDTRGTHAVVIDPAVSFDEVMRSQPLSPRIEAILLTHGHFDHILTLAEWREKTGAPICISREDAPALTDGVLNCHRIFFGEDAVYPAADRLLAEGDTVPFGDASLSVMLTPGHTAGSCLFVGEDVIFTGDTLFAEGSYGRYDLPGGSARALFASLSRIAHLEGDFRLYPGHGQSTTLNQERSYYISAKKEG